MNLSPAWVQFLGAAGIQTVHWSGVGDPRAKDSTLVDWGRKNGAVIFTHDLDFSALVAITKAKGPSVVIVRTQDVLPDAIGAEVVRVLRAHEAALEKGAIVTLDELAARVRILPIEKTDR